MYTLNALWKKFSKCVKLVLNLTHFEKKFQNALPQRGATTIVTDPQYIYHFGKFCYFLAKITLPSVLSHILMVHKTKSIVSSHFHRHYTPSLHLQSWKYMSAREYIFFSKDPCEYQYSLEIFGNIRKEIMYSLALIYKFWNHKKSVACHLHWNSHCPPTWAILT